MSTAYTANASLAKPGVSDRGWGTPINANADALDGMAAIGGLCVTPAEQPSASLNVRVAAGTYRKADGTFATYAGTSSVAMTASSPNYLYLTDAGVLTVSTTGFPATSHVRLATVVAGLTTITSIADSRVPFVSAGTTVYLALAGGTFADAGGTVTIGLGSTNGTRFGATTADKLGFWGATPVVQPSGASQAALGSATASTLTNSTTGTAGSTVGDVGTTFSQTTLNSIHASLVVQVNDLIADQAATRTLVTAIRAALVAAGLMKGSA